MKKYNKTVCGFCGRIDYEGKDPQTGLCKGYIDDKAAKSVDLDEFTKYKITLSVQEIERPEYGWESGIIERTDLDPATVAKITHCESKIHEALDRQNDPCPYRMGELISELSGIKLEDIFKVLQAEFIMEYERAEEDEYEDMMIDDLYDQMVKMN